MESSSAVGLATVVVPEFWFVENQTMAGLSEQIVQSLAQLAFDGDSLLADLDVDRGAFDQSHCDFDLAITRITSENLFDIGDQIL